MTSEVPLPKIIYNQNYFLHIDCTYTTAWLLKFYFMHGSISIHTFRFERTEIHNYSMDEIIDMTCNSFSSSLASIIYFEEAILILKDKLFEICLCHDFSRTIWNLNCSLHASRNYAQIKQ